jgi:hypothetical protein
LVVGDKKTPDSWSYKEVFFLDIKDQIELSKKYKIINQIPFNSYSRKMIAYLYAIEHKAKYIYEPDDDNSPLDGLFGFRYLVCGSGFPLESEKFLQRYQPKPLISIDCLLYRPLLAMVLSKLYAS